MEPTVEPERISYEWLKANGWHVLPRFERQPYDQCRRCIGMDSIGPRFLTCPEDLCIDVSPVNADCREWFVWITKAHANNNHPCTWIHVRQMQYAEELVALYEALTGREFTGETHWAKRKGKELFPRQKMQA